MTAKATDADSVEVVRLETPQEWAVVTATDSANNVSAAVILNSPKTDDTPFDVVEQMPEFPGGQEALMKFLSESVKYPKEAFKDGVQGRVVVQFVVEKDGSISEVEVVKKVNEHLDAEAVRVVNAMPKWKPGKQKGENVRVKYTLPISFRLS